MRYLHAILLSALFWSCTQDNVEPDLFILLDIAIVDEEGENFFLKEDYLIDSLVKVDPAYYSKEYPIRVNNIEGVPFAQYTFLQFDTSFLDFGNGDIDTFQLVGDGKHTFINDLFTSTIIDVYYNGEKQIQLDLPNGKATYYYDSGRVEDIRKRADFLSWPHYTFIFQKDSSSMDFPRK